MIGITRTLAGLRASTGEGPPVSVIRGDLSLDNRVEKMDNDRFRNWPGVARHHKWRKALREDETLKGVAACATAKPYGVDPRYVAICIADHGTNGHNCFPSAETIAEEIGCSPRTIKKWRTKLIDLGWFTVTGRGGGTRHHSLILDIAIPGENDESEVTTEAALSDQRIGLGSGNDRGR